MISSGNPDSRTGHDREVDEIVRSAAKVIRSEGRPKVADSILGMLATQAKPRPVVLVAGEDKRGKSSLVNALLGRRDLSPIGVAVVTGSPVSFFYSAEPKAAVRHYGAPTLSEIGFDTARQLATIEGNPGNEANIQTVFLGVDNPVLERMTLIDTPGVGGLYSGHAELTLQSLAHADALIFVSDSGVQFRAAELDFLRRASARIETVIIVLTKTDLHRGWRTILDDNKRVLTEQAPRFATAPIVPVSSTLALRALNFDDPDDAAAMRAESGMDRLESVISSLVLDRAATLADANRLRAVIGPLALAERQVRERLAANSGKAGPDRLQQEQARLRTFNAEHPDWTRRLDTEFRRVTLRRSESLALGLSDLRRRYDERLKDPSKQDTESLPGELVADLTALAGRLNDDASESLSTLLQSIVHDIDGAGVIDEAVSKLTTDRLGAQLAEIEMGSVGLTHYDRLSLMSTFVSGRSLSTLVTGSALGITTGLALVPGVGIVIGVGLGAVYAYQAFKGKRRATFSAEFRSWMNEQVSHTQTTINTTFQRELIDVQEEMRTFIRETLSDRQAEITASIEEAKAAASTAAEARANTYARLTESQQRIRRVQNTVTAALSKLSIPAPTRPGPAD